MNQSPLPTFAVVGHPNKGKSSLVACLAHDDQVLISPRSGTTVVKQQFPFQIDGVTYYQLVDTPGFQRARQTFDWLQKHAQGVHQRAQAISAFIQAHRDDDNFSAEVELLTPIMAGAGVIYVVDGSRPYGEEYEIEMQILRWTGQPSMALINLIGHRDYIEDWKRVLNQYFKIVRVFNPMTATFDDRARLLRGFSHLEERWESPLNDAATALEQYHQTLRAQSADLIVDLLIQSIGHIEQGDLAQDSSEEQKAAKLSEMETRYQQTIEKMEANTHENIAALYRHHRIQTEADIEISVVSSDLFSDDSWTIFGLDQTQLMATSITGGALAGGVIDLAVGGHSFFLGAGIGAAAAGLTTWFASREIANISLLGNSLGGHILRLGPIRERNFPYVLLSRALLHHQAVEVYSHADRSEQVIELSGVLLKNRALRQRLPFEKAFSYIRRGKGAEQREKLKRQILLMMEAN